MSVDVSQSDIRSVFKQELRTLQKQLKKSIKGTKDARSRMHLADVQARIKKVLEE